MVGGGGVGLLLSRVSFYSQSLISNPPKYLFQFSTMS